VLSADAGTVVLAALCYLGLVLYGGVLSVPGRSAFGASWQLVLFYIGFFPLPAGSLAQLAQAFVLAFAVTSLGPQVLGRHLETQLDYRGLRAGRPPTSLALPLRALLYAPAVVTAGWFLVHYGRVFLATGVPPAEVAATFARGMTVLGLMLGAYFSVSWAVGRPWARAGETIPLFATAARFHRMNGLGALALIVSATLLIVFELSPSMFVVVELLFLLLCLLPALNELAWSYDAVVSRVLTVHVLLLLCAVVVLVVPPLLSALGLGPAYVWPVVLALLVVASVWVPGSLSRAVERKFFPRAAAVRARFADLGSEPLAALTRGEAAQQLLARATTALDCEGGALVLAPEGTDPAEVHCVGSARAEPLGSPAAAARVLAELQPTLEVRRVDDLPLEAQLRLLSCAVVQLCPIGVDRLQATLLLGPRRGWLYDPATIEALRVFGHQAGLALQNATLLRARGHAEKLSALGEAAARIAHEIRNPLAAARSLVQLSVNGAGDDLNATALVELDRIGRLAGDLIAFARREDFLRLDDVDLAGVCQDALVQVGGLAEANGVRVRTDLRPFHVRADRDRLVQVVANLCRNAVEALAEKDSPRSLQVSIVGPTDGGSVAIEVRDDGPGIASDDLALVFEPFRTTKSSGTGLGLAIAQRIVVAHGGRLTVESELGAGTVFRCELTVARA